MEEAGDEEGEADGVEAPKVARPRIILPVWVLLV